MSLSDEQQSEIARFPEVLRNLIEEELAIGNTIVEIGHSFPAPPVGAYLKLARHVATRSRSTSNGLSFTERNHSLYSGEFTDQQRHFFVLEPPGVAANVKVQTSYQNSEKSSVNRTSSATASDPRERDAAINGQRSDLTQHESTHPNNNIHAAPPTDDPKSGIAYDLRFKDPRSPHEVRVLLERHVRALFHLSIEEGRLSMRASARVVGASYRLTLLFESATHALCTYRLRATVTWPSRGGVNDDYYRSTSCSWLKFWASDFSVTSMLEMPVDTEPEVAMPKGETSPLYIELSESAVKAEEHLDSVAALQNVIVAAMKRGAYFASSHKEGGTHIGWHGDRFVRSDYGESTMSESYSDESAFLIMLEKFCQFDLSLNSAGTELADIDKWRLIYRRLRARD